MPHVIIKMYTGRSEDQKQMIADEVAKTVSEKASCHPNVVSVSIEEYEPADWPEAVFRPDIRDKKETLYRKPGYDPFAKTEAPEQDRERLMTFVRTEASKAGQEDTTGFFNPMSWLDLKLEDAPEFFDACFKTPWHQLDDAQKGERADMIRSVL